MTIEQTPHMVVELTVFDDSEVTDVEDFHRRGDEFMQAIKKIAPGFGLRLTVVDRGGHD